MMTPVYLKYKLSERRRSDFVAQVDSLRDIRLNTDLSPAALYYDLSYHSSADSPHFAALMQRIQRIHLYQLGIALMLVSFLVLWRMFYRRGRKVLATVILIPVVTSGFIGLGIPVVYALLFQSLFGYIYSWIGLLLTSFMSGLAAGSLWVNHRLQYIRNEINGLIILLVLLMIYLLLIILILNYIGTVSLMLSATSTKLLLLISTAACGFLVGAQFPLANKIYLGTHTSISKTGGQVYGADLIGAWLGGITVTVLLIPLYGIINTIMVFLVVNFIALSFVILIARKFR